MIKKLKSIEILDEYTDDGCLMLDVLVNEEVKVGLWWYDFDFSYKVKNFKKHKKEVLEAINNSIDNIVD